MVCHMIWILYGLKMSDVINTDENIEEIKSDRIRPSYNEDDIEMTTRGSRAIARKSRINEY